MKTYGLVQDGVITVTVPAQILAHDENSTVGSATVEICASHNEFPGITFAASIPGGYESVLLATKVVDPPTYLLDAAETLAQEIAQALDHLALGKDYQSPQISVIDNADDACALVEAVASPEEFADHVYLSINFPTHQTRVAFLFDRDDAIDLVASIDECAEMLRAVAPDDETDETE